MQKYQPSYEPLSDTLKRLMSHGLTETNAKLDICLALRDRKRKIEVLATIRLVDSAGRTIATFAGRPIIDPRFQRDARFVGPIDVQIVIPRDLAPDHIDWENSGLLKPVPCGGGLFAIITRLELLIENVKREWRLTTPAAQESTAPAPATNGAVTRAISFFKKQLKDDPDLRPVDLKPLLPKHNLALGRRQLRDAWMFARRELELKPTKPGRPKKSTQR
jgi:hypothetical protein